MPRQPPDTHVEKAVEKTARKAASKKRPDQLDDHEKRALSREAGAADLLHSAAEGRRADTSLRKLVTYVLSGLLIVLVLYFVVMLTLKDAGTINDISGLATFYAPGGIAACLVTGLVFVIRRK